MENCRNPLVAEGEYVSPMTKISTIKLLISVANDGQNESGGNSDAEMSPSVIKNITKKKKKKKIF